jgi:hypothetical protein
VTSGSSEGGLGSDGKSFGASCTYATPERKSVPRSVDRCVSTVCSVKRSLANTSVAVASTAIVWFRFSHIASSLAAQ